MSDSWGDYRRNVSTGSPRWYTSLVSESTAEPVATSDIKKQLNLPTTDIDDDIWISGAIKAARHYAERRMRRALQNKTYDLILDAFPHGDDPVEFPFPPLSSISSITYYDANNSSTTLASSDYRTLARRESCGAIVPAVDATWPSSRDREDAVTIRFVAGFGSGSTDTPPPIRHAIKMLVSHWYEMRSSVLVGQASKPIEHAFDALTEEYVHRGYQ